MLSRSLADLLSPLAELSRYYFATGGWTGVHLIVYGVLLVAAVLFFPQGAVPWLRRVVGRAPA